MWNRCLISKVCQNPVSTKGADIRFVPAPQEKNPPLYADVTCGQKRWCWMFTLFLWSFISSLQKYHEISQYSFKSVSPIPSGYFLVLSNRCTFVCSLCVREWVSEWPQSTSCLIFPPNPHFKHLWLISYVGLRSSSVYISDKYKSFKKSLLLVFFLSSQCLYSCTGIGQLSLSVLAKGARVVSYSMKCLTRAHLFVCLHAVSFTLGMWMFAHLIVVLYCWPLTFTVQCNVLQFIIVT